MLCVDCWTCYVECSFNTQRNKSNSQRTTFNGQRSTGTKDMRTRLRFLFSILFLAGCILAQDNPNPEALRLLQGSIDIHVHSDPDDRPRSIDAIDVAKLAKARGMRAIVLKNHYDPTGPLAYVVRKEVPGIEVFGGVDLNL